MDDALRTGNLIKLKNGLECVLISNDIYKERVFVACPGATLRRVKPSEITKIKECGPVSIEQLQYWVPVIKRYIEKDKKADERSTDGS